MQTYVCMEGESLTPADVHDSTWLQFMVTGQYNDPNLGRFCMYDFGNKHATFWIFFQNLLQRFSISWGTVLRYIYISNIDVSVESF